MVQTVFVPQGNIITTTIVEDTRIEDHTYHTTHLPHDDDRRMMKIERGGCQYSPASDVVWCGVRALHSSLFERRGGEACLGSPPST